VLDVVAIGVVGAVTALLEGGIDDASGEKELLVFKTCVDAVVDVVGVDEDAADDPSTVVVAAASEGVLVAEVALLPDDEAAWVATVGHSAAIPLLSLSKNCPISESRGAETP
jgi:hypothetical protein